MRSVPWPAVRYSTLAVSAAILSAAWAGAVDARAPKDMASTTPDVVRRLVDCRTLADGAARLACYDREAAALNQAVEARDVVIADKAEMKSARRGLFGFKLPSLNIFGKGREDDDEVSEIASTVAAARPVAGGGWRITLADGAVWEQISTDQLVMDPRAGDKVTIKRGALGSYRASIDGQPGVKMRRVE